VPCAGIARIGYPDTGKNVQPRLASAVLLIAEVTPRPQRGAATVPYGDVFQAPLEIKQVTGAVRWQRDEHGLTLTGNGTGK
jgi:hypothetical protein